MTLRRVDFMNTAFRDGFQSVYGARVFTDDFIPAVEAAAAAGLTHFEAGGGARFQSTYFYSNEDAFEMMDRFRTAAGPDANLQTLSRGVNVVGLTSQSRDIIRLHAKLFAKHGITTIRNFDALNDVNNLVDSGQAIVDAGARHEVCVTLMSLPEGVTGAHDPDFYERTLRDILDAEIPYHSVCFKDASGTTTPAVVHETVRRARKLLGSDTHIVFHSHDTAGVCVAQYLAALDAGADQIDLSMAPVSGGTCQVDIMTMYHALRGTEYTLGIDPAKVYEAEEVFKECMKDYFVPPEARAVEPLIPLSPMPGGALTANTQMLRDNGLMDRYDEIARNMGECVMKGGFGTSVTPVSQFYFQQAFNNTMFGPWQKFADGYGKMVLGHFGRTPVPPDPEVVEAARVQMGLEPTDRLVADMNDENPKLGIEAAKRLLLENGITDLSEENIFIAATCLDKGIQFLKGEAKANVRKVQPEPEPAPAAAKPTGVNVTVNGTAYAVRFEGDRAVVNGKAYDVAVTPLDDGAAPAEPAAAATLVPVKAPMPGLVLRLSAQEGDVVELHDELLILEAMKMESRISATTAGTVRHVHVRQGEHVKAGDVLVEIEA
ncbi:MAG: biotin/lipoyl-binding protein [Actinobacteria bacterium]|nr:biotin/lipoyl-binding protein [Actinomycetota bacterium]